MCPLICIVNTTTVPLYVCILYLCQDMPLILGRGRRMNLSTPPLLSDFSYTLSTRSQAQRWASFSSLQTVVAVLLAQLIFRAVTRFITMWKCHSWLSPLFNQVFFLSIFFFYHARLVVWSDAFATHDLHPFWSVVNWLSTVHSPISLLSRSSLAFFFSSEVLSRIDYTCEKQMLWPYPTPMAIVHYTSRIFYLIAPPGTCYFHQYCKICVKNAAECLWMATK